jgi:hypothetical protein
VLSYCHCSNVCCVVLCFSCILPGSNKICVFFFSSRNQGQIFGGTRTTSTVFTKLNDSTSLQGALCRVLYVNDQRSAYAYDPCDVNNLV